jgi:hypothetical protein
MEERTTADILCPQTAEYASFKESAKLKTAQKAFGQKDYWV